MSCLSARSLFANILKVGGIISITLCTTMLFPFLINGRKKKRKDNNIAIQMVEDLNIIQSSSCEREYGNFVDEIGKGGGRRGPLSLIDSFYTKYIFYVISILSTDTKSDKSLPCILLF